MIAENKGYNEQQKPILRHPRVPESQLQSQLRFSHFVLCD
jgi:hypothetical protein